MAEKVGDLLPGSTLPLKDIMVVVEGVWHEGYSALRDDTRRQSASLLLDPLLPTVREIAHLMLEREVVITEKEDGRWEAE